MAIIHPAAILRAKEPEYTNMIYTMEKDLANSIKFTNMLLERKPIGVFDV